MTLWSGLGRILVVRVEVARFPRRLRLSGPCALMAASVIGLLSLTATPALAAGRPPAPPSTWFLRSIA
jgi:hypothetical protein